MQFVTVINLWFSSNTVLSKHMEHKSKYIQSTLTSAEHKLCDQVQGSYLPANLYTLE